MKTLIFLVVMYLLAGAFFVYSGIRAKTIGTPWRWILFGLTAPTYAFARLVKSIFIKKDKSLWPKDPGDDMWDNP